NKERKIKAYIESKNNLYKQVEELKEEKERIFTKFLSDYDMFLFEQNGNSLKILYRKNEGETWQDITEQPEFYKERSKD
ncbi:hypothetical protein ACFL6H_09585, partial [Candidatus Latescibacterota bacterium]